MTHCFAPSKDKKTFKNLLVTFHIYAGEFRFIRILMLLDGFILSDVELSTSDPAKQDDQDHEGSG